MKTLIAPKKRTSSEDTLGEVLECYGGKKWVREIDELFPPTEFGCINFGYWEQLPDKISAELREKSQLDLYRKLCEFAEINRNKRATVLEVGCGRGHGVNLLALNGQNSYGIDAVKSQIQKCRAFYPTLKSHFKQSLSNQTGFEANFFDFVISVEAAQHFHNFFSFAREAYRVLRQGGKIAVTTFFYPNSRSRGKLKNIIPQDISGTHHAIPIFKAEEFLKRAGFQNIEVVSIGSQVFEGFCRWATQSMSEKNHTPRWVEAYEKKLLDYYLIKGEKLSLSNGNC